MDPHSYRSATPKAEDVLNRSRESSHSNGSNHSTSADKQPRLFGWVKNALAGGSRSTSPTPPSVAAATTTAPPSTLRPDPSATPKPRIDNETVAASSSQFSPALPSRNLAAEFDRNESRASSFDIDDDGTYSTGHFSISDDGEEGESDDEELYVPFPAATSSAAASPIAPLPSAGMPGLVKPTARRSVSLSHGHAAELEAEVQRLTIKDEQNRQERQRQSQNGGE